MQIKLVALVLLLAFGACKTGGRVNKTAAFSFGGASNNSSPPTSQTASNADKKKVAKLSTSVSKNANPERAHVVEHAKLSEKLGITIPADANIKLLTAIASWLGTPYKWGGTTKNGADCSGFVYGIFKSVYGKIPPRTSRAQFTWCQRIKQKNTRAGDLVFFKIGGSRISHVGIYLNKQYFVHASSSSGVVVSSLNQDYYKKHFFAAGKPPVE